MDFQLNVPFTKVDKARRMVTGIATADNVDKEDDVIDFAGSVDAFNSWPGNVREMHMPKAVGKMIDFKPVAVKGTDGSVYSGMETTIYISKGAEDTWTKVLDGTLKGFSVGGDIIDSEYEFNKSTNKSVRRVKKYAMHELSLVDNPANPVSKFTMIKSHSNDAGENVLELEGTNSFSDIKPLFYCDIDGVAKVDESFCGDHEMKQIGFVEDFNTQEIRKMIESYENHKNGGEKSESVLHKNTNTGIVNNMEELNETQKETIVKRFTKFLFDNENEGESKTDKNIDGLFSPVFNINVPTAAAVESVIDEPVVVDEPSEEAKTEDEVKDETEAENAEEGGDNVDTNEVVEKVTSTLLEKLDSISKSFDERFENLEKSVDEKVDSVKAEVDTAKGDLEKFANDGAISKSVETDSDDESDKVNDNVEETKLQTDSFWKGAFVDEAIISALGYES
jgi:Caudovirus prohead serine protease